MEVNLEQASWERSYDVMGVVMFGFTVHILLLNNIRGQLIKSREYIEYIY